MSEDTAPKGTRGPLVPENDGSLAKIAAGKGIPRGLQAGSIMADNGFLRQNGLPLVSVPLFVTGQALRARRHAARADNHSKRSAPAPDPM